MDSDALCPGVYLWGCANDGVLGLGAEASDQYHPFRLQIPQSKRIVQACAGCSHSVLVTDSGEAMTFGYGEAVGRRDSQTDVCVVEELEVKRVAFASAGNTSTFVVTDENHVYSTGQNDYGELGSEDTSTRTTFRPARILRELPIICEIACGAHHAAIRTIRGEVYTWGQGTYGQIGQGTTDNSLQLKPITKLFGKAIVKIASGEAHTLALTVNGEVYGWGRDKYGQLGNGKGQQSRLTCSRIKGLSHTRIVDIACGSDHSVLLSETGRVYTFGCGQNGQLGHGSTENLAIPTPVEGSLLREIVTQICCGRAHTMAVTNTNRIFVWGSNENGQLCLSPEIKLQSTPISSTSLNFGTKKVQLYSGSSADHIIAIVSEDEEAPQQPRKHVSKLNDQYHVHRIGLNPTFGMVDWDYFENVVAAARSSSTYDNLIKLIRHVFSSPAVFLSCFVQQNSLPLPEARAVLLYDRLDEVYKTLNSCENKIVLTIWVNELRHLLESCCAGGNPAEFPMEMIYIFLLTLQNRVFAVDESSPSSVIIERACQLATKLPASFQAHLRRYWEELSSERFLNQLQNLQWYITKSLISNGASASRDSMLASVFAMCKEMYMLNEQKGFISPTQFEVHEITKHFNKEPQRLLEDIEIWRSKSNRFCFSSYHFLMETTLKADILKIEAALMMRMQVQDSYWHSFYEGRPIPIYLQLEVSRDRIVSDTLSQLMHYHPAEMKKPLKVKFRDEEGIDEGGVKREFFQLLVRDLFNPKYGMFTYFEDTRVHWFNSSSFETDEFRLVGLVLGLAIYNGVNLDAALPHIAYKKLMGKAATLDDLSGIDPALVQGLKSLLEFDGDVEDTFCKNFTVTVKYFDTEKVVELKPGGTDIPVTNDNRKEYVELLVKYYLESSIEAQFQPFMQGFFTICGGSVRELLRPDELELLICGDPDLNTKEMEAVTLYEGGYHPAHPTIRQFWNIVHNEFSQKQKKKLLFFITGSDRVSVGGFSKMRFVIQRSGPDTDRLPTAHTCFNFLLLPEYSNVDKMRERLVTAIENAEGFGLK
eukprot:TRINITY_DN5372_c0_g1_i2.p1 TRINITY_DN5372_c0_g1~~TRINITY_DN5372_c0_g1_i2.p1  ORF type:complete len:1044 (+),score=190.77 TRINITY_DN5372_c0_g1_i2:73-3204(+)